MAAINNHEAMKHSLQILQQQAEDTEERATRLQRRVEEERLTWEQAEAEVVFLSRQIQGVEKDLDSAREGLQTVLWKLEGAAKAANENERSMKVIQGQATKNEEKLELQAFQLKEAMLLAVAMNKKFEETIHNLIIERDLEGTGERLMRAESHSPETDAGVRSMDQNLTCLDAAEPENTQKEYKYEQEIKMLSEKLKATEARAKYAENLTTKMEKTINDLEEKLKFSKEAHLTTQKMLAQTLLELNEM
ncbi:tropomyosin-like [Notamacropus eugenii]|uniref:tropomyosin-like n=1 Tax=Notamacropus eugenii TaxID=9315 RepID=UPI003B67FC40